MAEPRPQRVTEATPLTGTRIGRFLLGERIGSGGMGEVYCAEDTRLHRRVALKRLNPHLQADAHYRERLLREAQLASRLIHPNLAAIHDVLEQEDGIWLVMELVEGETLRDRMQTGIGVEEVIDIGLQCAQALGAAHAAGLVHCDIKPDNIMLSGPSINGPEAVPAVTVETVSLDTATRGASTGAAQVRVKVLDFGVAKALAGGKTGLTSDTFSLSGTPGYIAPELLQEKIPDGRADIFSLGVVLYEALAGYNPFHADTLFATADRILKEDPPRLRSENSYVSPELEAIVHKMIAKDRDQRYANADELVSDLRALEQPPHLRHLIAEVRGGRNRRIALLAIAVLFCVGLAVAAYRVGVLQRWFGAKPTLRNIAVMPFDSPGEAGRGRAFSDGLAATVASKLTQLGDRYPIQVIPPAEVRDQGVSNTEQARQLLGVNLVLTGTLRSAGNLVRVNYQLIDVQTRRELRGDTITAEAGDPFAVEDQVVESVLKTLEIALGPQERRQLVAHRTSEPQAYDYYLQGRGYLQDYHKEENLDGAVKAFQQALERDPHFALAYAGQGIAYWYRFDLSKDPNLIAKAHEACDRAVALDATAAEGHLCLGMVFEASGKYPEAVKQLQEAVQLQPRMDENYRWLARAYDHSNNLALAEDTYKRAISLRPNYWGGHNALGAFYYRHRRLPEAVAAFQKVIELAPDNVRGYTNLGGLYVVMGQYEKAITALERAAALRPTAAVLSNLGTAYFYLRRFPEAAASYERAVTLSPHDHVIWGNLGEAHYWTPGRKQQANRALTEALRLVQEDLKLNPRDAEALHDGAAYAAMMGDRRTAEDYIKRSLALTPNDSEARFKAAVVYRLFGDTAQSLSWLQKALAAGYGADRVRDDPAFDKLKGDPRLEALLRK